MDKKKQILARAAFLYYGIGLLAIAIIVQIIRIQFVEGPDLRKKSENLTLELKSIEPLRGNIFSADGNFLAISLPIYEIRFDGKADGLKDDLFNENLDSLAWNLSNLFRDKSKEEYKQILKSARSKGNRYQLIQKNVGYTQLQKLKNFPLFKLGSNKSGLIIITTTKRIKPYKNLASRTIGRATGEGNYHGLEYAYNETLAGTEGVRLMQKLQGGFWKPVNDDYEIEPRNGSDIYTTIDISLQEVLHNELATQLAKSNAGHGTAIVMEVQTGAIKAIANLQRDANGNYYEGDNFAIREAVEPGSTFKLATVLALLDDKKVKPEDTIQTGNGVATFYGVKLKDSHEGGFGNITIQQAFEKSSNIAFAKLVIKHYGDNPQKFVDKLAQFHLTEPTGIKLGGEPTPLIKNPNDKTWSKITLPWMSIGYESQLTALQIVTFYNAVANGGKMVRPKLVSEIKEHGKSAQKFETEVIKERIASEEAINQARKMMEGVVLRGTAKNLNGLIYSIGGKTGTAQVAKAGGYKQGGVSYRASFVGYFPADKPKYTCIVVVSAPSNSVYYGNLVAGPVFKAAADKIYAGALDIHSPINVGRPVAADSILPKVKTASTYAAKNVLDYLNINTKVLPKANIVAKSNIEGNKVVFSPININDKILPNLRGMGAKDALYILEKLNCTVQIEGRGSVVSQDPLPGTALKKGMNVKLYLSI